MGVKKKKGSGKVLIFLLYAWIGRFISEETHVKVGLSRTSCPSSRSRRRVPMHLHTAAAVYKEATRPATERGSTSFSTTPLLLRCRKTQNENCNKAVITS